MSSRRIVAVDDQRDLLEIIEMAFGLDTDWEIATYLSVAEAVEAPAAADAVLLDLSVADPDPAAAVTALRGTTEGAAVILLTGARLSPEQFAATAADGLISKPFDVFALAGQISELLGWTDD